MQFFGLSLYSGTYSAFFSSLFECKKPTLVFTPNPEMFYSAYHDEDFMETLKKADYNVPDGNGLYVASMMQEGKGFFSACMEVFLGRKAVGGKYGEIIKGSDLTRDILEWRRKEQIRILVLDKKNPHPRNEFEQKKSQVQKNLKNILEEKYPNVTVHVIFDGEMWPDAIAHYIELHKIEFVFSCLGMKTQESRLLDIFSYLPDDFPIVWLGVGASIDFLLWLQKRSPKIFQDLGLEWLYRLMTQPRIRARRIKTALIDFPKLVRAETKKETK